MGYAPKWYDNRELLVMKYIEQHKSIADMAQLFGVTEQTVRNLLKKHNLIRSR